MWRMKSPIVVLVAAVGATNPTHYGDPKGGCEPDESAFLIQGVTGDVCTPKCAAGECPSDVPAGVTASPQCAAQQGADRFCLLVCTAEGPNQCGAGTCQSISNGVGVCTYAREEGLLGSEESLETGPLSKAAEAFERFVEQFGKVYEEAGERARRFSTFVGNFFRIDRENSQGHTYTLGVNQFTDLTQEEFKAQYLQYRRPAHKDLWGGLPHLGTHVYSGAPLADSVDWTAKGAVTPAKDQGRCGSCWSFSSTGSLEGAWQIATGTLTSFSEQQLVDCAKNGNAGCQGGQMDAAFTYLENQSVCTEASYPYTAKDGVCHQSNCTAGIPAHGVTGFKDVSANSMEALMEAVAQQPVSVAIEADQTSFQSYHSGVLTGTCGTKLDHGVLVVGYGTDTVTGTDYWKVKNSWAASWGEQGYLRLQRTSGSGECGIDLEPSYPVVSGQPGSTVLLLAPLVV